MIRKKNVLQKWIARLLSCLVIANGLISIAISVTFFIDKPLAHRLYIFYTHLTHVKPFETINNIIVLILGIVMLLLGIGLFQRHRRAWKLSIFVLILLLLTSVFPTLKPEPFGLYLINLLLFCFTQNYFNKKAHRSARGQAIALLLLIAALVYGILGSYLMRAHFQGINTMIDSTYFTFVTYSTVGYGDIVPLDSSAKLFVVSMILIGLGAFATAITVFVLPFMEREIKKVFTIMNNFNSIKNHLIILGFNEISQALADNLKDKKHIVFCESDVNKVNVIEQKGYQVFLGDIANENLIKELNLFHANAILCLDDNDANNILTVMSVAMLKNKYKKKSPKIVARVNNPANIDKASIAGANEVFSPTLICEKHLETII